jgi:hypothetical protein
MPNGCRTKNGDCMGDEGKAVGIAQAPAALLSARCIGTKAPLGVTTHRVLF